MLTVTTRALQKLKEALQVQTSDLKQAIRLVLTPSGIAPLDFILDEEGEGDQVVLCEEGRKILFVGPSLADALRNMEIDYRMTPIGCTFALLPLTPVN